MSLMQCKSLGLVGLVARLLLLSSSLWKVLGPRRAGLGLGGAGRTPVTTEFQLVGSFGGCEEGRGVLLLEELHKQDHLSNKPGSL